MRKTTSVQRFSMHVSLHIDASVFNENYKNINFQTRSKEKAAWPTCPRPSRLLVQYLQIQTAKRAPATTAISIKSAKMNNVSFVTLPSRQNAHNNPRKFPLTSVLCRAMETAMNVSSMVQQCVDVLAISPKPR